MRKNSSETVVDVAPVTEVPTTDSVVTAAKRAAAAEAAGAKAAQLITERKFTEAQEALREADVLSAEPTEAERNAAERLAKAEAARVKAAQLISERKFAEAQKSLQEADELEAGPIAAAAVEDATWKNSPKRLFKQIRSHIPKRHHGEESAPVTEPATELGPVDRATQIVSLYSKFAAGAGLVPGVLNFAAILAVQVTMVWRIGKVFGHDERKDQIRGSILSLFGSLIPTGIGHGAGLAVASIPVAVAGTVIYFVATPVLAYAMTKAVGNAFIMHFESGGTLLTFDPKAFAAYITKEFHAAGGVVGEAVVPPAATVNS